VSTSRVTSKGQTTIPKEIRTETIFTYADENIDYIDAFNARWMKQQSIEMIYTFDQKHYKRIQGIRAKAPPLSRRQNK